MSKLTDGSWPFDQAPNVAAITTAHVTGRSAPILVVVHYNDDHSWAFLDGGPWSIKNAMMVSMQSMLDRDPSLRGIADLTPGWMARRAHVGAEWERDLNPDDAETE